MNIDLFIYFNFVNTFNVVNTNLYVMRTPMIWFNICRYNMKLYSVSDGPPSLACQQLLKALDIKYELVNVNFGKGDHMTEEYEKV